MPCHALHSWERRCEVVAETLIAHEARLPTAAPRCIAQDVEKLAAKEGVVLQTVKEVLQSLVDDDMVHQDRIGASNYFW